MNSVVKPAAKTKQIEEKITQVGNYHDLSALIAGNNSGFIAKVGTNIRNDTGRTAFEIKSLNEPSRRTIPDPRPASGRFNTHQ